MILAQSQNATINLLNTKVEITSDRVLYNAIRNKYKKIAMRAQEKFEEYNKQFEDINDLLSSAPDAFILSIEDAILELIQDIISMDVYTVDKDAVINKAFDGDYFDEFCDAYGLINNIYEKIISDLSDAEEYRNARKASRPRWQSATIGGNAINAWSNQLESASMNLAEGAVHSVINAIGNAIDKSTARDNLKKLFENEEYRQNMIDSVYYSCFNIHLLLIEIINQESEFEIDGTVSDTDREKANAMFNNFMSIELSEERKADFIKKIFQLDPYEESFYKLLIMRFRDKNNELGKTADYFGLDSYKIKNNVIIDYVKENLGDTEADVYKCKNDIVELANNICFPVDEIKYANDIINEKLKALDLEYRTVDGIVFETREIANVAKTELKYINKLMKDVQPPTKESTLEYENDLNVKINKISALSTDVKKKYIETLDQYLTRFDQLFRNEGIFSSGVSREEAGRQRALEFIKKQQINTYEDFDNATKALNDFLPKVGITIDQAPEVVSYIETQRNRLNTVDGIVFVNRDDAEKGRQEYKKIAEIMSDVSAPTSESFLDYEENLLNVRNQLLVFSTPVKDKYVNLVDRYLTKFDELFRRAGGFTMYETREQAARMRTLKYVKGLFGYTYTYQDVDNAFAAIPAFVNKVGIKYSDAVEAIEYLRSLENTLNTVDGVMFDSRDKAAFARQEYAEISKIMANVEPPKNDSLLDYENNLLNIRNRINLFSTPVKNKYLMLIDKYLTAFDEKFRRISLMKVAQTREEAARDKALKFVKQRSYTTLEDVEMARNDFKQYSPYIGITLANATEANNYLINMENKINGIAPQSKFGGLFGKFKNK